MTNESNTIFTVGDFWPDDLFSNKKGTQNVVLSTLADQIDGCVAILHYLLTCNRLSDSSLAPNTDKLKDPLCYRYLAQNLVSEEDIFVVQAGEVHITFYLTVSDQLGCPNEAAVAAQATTT